MIEFQHRSGRKAGVSEPACTLPNMPGLCWYCETNFVTHQFPLKFGKSQFLLRSLFRYLLWCSISVSVLCKLAGRLCTYFLSMCKYLNIMHTSFWLVGGILKRKFTLILDIKSIHVLESAVLLCPSLKRTSRNFEIKI